MAQHETNKSLMPGLRAKPPLPHFKSFGKLLHSSRTQMQNEDAVLQQSENVKETGCNLNRLHKKIELGLDLKSHPLNTCFSLPEVNGSINIPSNLPWLCTHPENVSNGNELCISTQCNERNSYIEKVKNPKVNSEEIGKERDKLLGQLPAVKNDPMLWDGFPLNNCVEEGSDSHQETKEGKTLEITLNNEMCSSRIKVPVKNELNQYLQGSSNYMLEILTEKHSKIDVSLKLKENALNNKMEIKENPATNLPFNTSLSSDGLYNCCSFDTVDQNYCALETTSFSIHRLDNALFSASQSVDFPAENMLEKSSSKDNDLNITGNAGPSGSTYDDIVHILKELEEEEKIFPFDQRELIMTSVCGSAVPANDESSTQDILPTSGKLEDILAYLDAVDQSCNIALDSARTRLQTVQDCTEDSKLMLSEMPRLEELLNLGIVDLANEVLILRLQLEERSNSITLLQEALNQQHELTLRNARGADHDMKKRLKQQKEEYQSIINRHQIFIDQLISDKTSLSEKYETLIRELKTSEERHASNLKASEERHKIEMQRVKEMHAAAEKLRRERWIDNRTKKIKEMTVKGLEPELRRMNIRHQQEISDLRNLHKQELEEVELRASRRASQQMEQLREQTELEKNEFISKEKELMRHKMTKQQEEEGAVYEAKQRELLIEMEVLRVNFKEEVVKLTQKAEESKELLSKEHAKGIEQIRKDCKNCIESAKKKCQNEMKDFRDKLEMDKEAWANSYKKTHSAIISKMEEEMREKFKKERDHEIELVIERLENEAIRVRAEQETVAENRLRRLKDKYDVEVKELEASEEAFKNKYTKIKSEIVEKEDEIINLTSYIRQVKKELEEYRKIADCLSSERAEVKEIIRNEFADQTSIMEKENAKMREEIAQIKTRHELEIAHKEHEIGTLKVEKDKELDEVYRRVKLAIIKKEKAVQHLETQHASALQRCVQLEELLAQQRHDFLLK